MLQSIYMTMTEHRPHGPALFVSVCRLYEVKPGVVPRVNCRGSHSTKQHSLLIVSLDHKDQETFHTFDSRTGQLRDALPSARES